MKMNLCVVTALAVIFLSSNVTADTNERCTSYNGSDGACIILSTCDELLEMITTSSRAKMDHKDAIAIIQKSTCGFIQSEPMVCCPGKQSDEDSWKNSIADVDNGYDAEKPATTTPPNISTTPLQQITTVKPKPQNPQNFNPLRPTTKLPDITTPGIQSTHTTKHPSGFTTKIISTVLDGGHTAFVTTTSTPSTQVSSTFSTVTSTTQRITSTSGTSTTESYMDPVFEEQTKLLPKQCGRVLTFKHFFGNRTDLDDFPWLALVAYDTPNGKLLGCGGSLINNRYVLTAAHCVNDLNPTWKVRGVRFGEYNTSSEIDCLPDGSDNSTFCIDKPIDVEIEEIIVHPGFMPLDRSRLHDIALLRLAEEIQFTNYIKPICLPFREPYRQRYYTSGWGRNGQIDGTDLKYVSYLTLADQNECAKQYQAEGISISNNQLCAGVKSVEKACVGDLGGPLMGIEEQSNQEKRVTVFGVLSLIHSPQNTCNYDGWPGIYSKVADYVPWILSQLRP